MIRKKMKIARDIDKEAKRIYFSQGLEYILLIMKFLGDHRNENDATDMR